MCCCLLAHCPSPLALLSSVCDSCRRCGPSARNFLVTASELLGKQYSIIGYACATVLYTFLWRQLTVQVVIELGPHRYPLLWNRPSLLQPGLVTCMGASGKLSLPLMIRPIYSSVDCGLLPTDRFYMQLLICHDHHTKCSSQWFSTNTSNPIVMHCTA